jgi:OHCU decarboxylase
VSKAVPNWAEIILGSGITLGSLTAILLNLVFHHVGHGRGPAVAGAPGTGQVRLEQVNSMSREEFADTFGPLFQGPRWVVENAYDQRPFTDTQALRTAFQEALFTAPPQRQAELMSFYPALGGDSVASGDEGAYSHGDQSTAGLTRLTDEDHAAFTELTDAYRDRFGFPLIVSVRDAGGRDQILESGWARMNNSATQEHATALIEMAKIANHRFDDLVAEANPIHTARTRRFDQLH